MNKNNSIQDRCLETLRSAALTADEVATKIGESILAVRPSICMLSKCGLIVKTGGKRKNVSGKEAHVWTMKSSVTVPLGDNPESIPIATLALIRQAKKLGYSAVDAKSLIGDSPMLDAAIKEVYGS